MATTVLSLAKKSSTKKQSKPAPFVKWVGGKGRLLSDLQQYIPAEIGRYAEPFVGGGAVFYHLAAQHQLSEAILADVNPDVVNAYRVVKSQVEPLIVALMRHEKCYLSLDAEGRKAYFYEVRSRHPMDVEMNAVERAARMLFLNRTCFNGLWRENRSGRFNTPHGRYAKPRIARAPQLRLCSQVLDKATVLERDFRLLPKLCRDHQIDFVYLDPPYHPISQTSAFNAYSNGGFSSRDQAELAEVCAELDRMDVRWVLSNSDCELIRSLYTPFNIGQIWAPRAVNSDASKRGRVSEVVVVNRRKGLPW
ncbi:MAG TPA: DNA methyltransferase [Myxococcales bacterium]|nr:DNA methyltransferase [Myxococcales bacterium]